MSRPSSQTHVCAIDLKLLLKTNELPSFTRAPTAAAEIDEERSRSLLQPLLRDKIPIMLYYPDNAVMLIDLEPYIAAIAKAVGVTAPEQRAIQPFLLNGYAGSRPYPLYIKERLADIGKMITAPAADTYSVEFIASEPRPAGLLVSYRQSDAVASARVTTSTNETTPSLVASLAATLTQLFQSKTPTVTTEPELTTHVAESKLSPKRG